MNDLYKKFSGFYDSTNNPNFAEITKVYSEGNAEDKQQVNEWALKVRNNIKTKYVGENATSSPPLYFIQELKVDDIDPFLSGLVAALRLVDSGADTPKLVHDDNLIKQGVDVKGTIVTSLEEIVIANLEESDWRVIGWETTRDGDDIIDTIIWRDNKSLRRVLTFSKWDHYPDVP